MKTIIPYSLLMCTTTLGRVLISLMPLYARASVKIQIKLLKQQKSIAKILIKGFPNIINPHLFAN